MLSVAKRWLRTKLISDRKFAERQYEHRMGKALNLQDPRTFNEKIQWLKLNWRQDILTQCADKYEVRNFVQERIGADILKRLHGVFGSVDEIDVNQLPGSFLLKVNHGSGQNIVCPDKSNLDWQQTAKLLKRHLKRNLYYLSREWAYKNITPRILCEEYVRADGQPNYDYNFYCFNGMPRFMEVTEDRLGSPRVSMFDLEGNLLERRYNTPPLTPPYIKPRQLDKMIEIAALLSRGFPFVRVDLLLVQHKIYFGEMTFYPLNGLINFRAPHFDEFLGSFLQLPDNAQG
ncbi:MAG TPA: hypothetical protein DEA44_06580 [Firmicutes bacterium]|nr:hypothetical protein [Bacillota bacterium]